MAAPTQEYPPWLTPIVTVVNDPFGVPFTTFTSVAYLPLTYYGPPIPLGPDWTYGGLVSPTTTMEVPSPTPTTLSTPPPTTAIPTDSASSSSLSTSASTTLSPTLSSVIPPSSTSPSTTSLPPTSTIPTPTSTATQANGGGRTLGRGQLIGIIIAGILAFIFLLVVFLCLWLWWKNHRHRTRNSTTNFETITPLTDGYHIVRGEEGQRAPGEGSPRHSGEERDPFLQPSSAGPSRPRQPTIPMPQPRHYDYPELAVPEPGSRARNSVGTGGRNSSGTNSGYGDPLEKPTLDVGPVAPDDPYFRRGTILSTEELQRVDEETYLPPGTSQPSAYMALTPAPVLPRDYAKSRTPHVHFTPRAKVIDGFSKPSPIYEDHPLPPLPANESGYLDASDDYRISWLRGSIANIARFSWFSRLSNSSKPASRYNLRANDPDIEALLSSQPSSPPQMTERTPVTPLLLRNVTPVPPVPPLPTSLAFPTPKSFISSTPPPHPPTQRVQQLQTQTTPRPTSGVSGQSGTSGGTVYYDAASSLPPTPSLVRPAPAALSSSARASPDLWPAAVITPQRRTPPPAFDTRPLFVASSTSTPPPRGRQIPQGNVNMTSSPAAGFDILDTPAPSALAPLVSSRSSRTRSHSNNPFLSLISQDQDQEMDVTSTSQDAETATIFTLSGPPPAKTPLGLKTKSTWGESTTSASDEQLSRSTTLETSFSVSMDGSTIDVLEEEPPVPGEGWRAMAAVVSHGGGRMGRSVFGMPVPALVHPPPPGLPASERASVYSGSGSERRTRAEQSSSSSGSYYGSASSKAGSASANEALARSLNESRSRSRPERMISPALSAFGQGHGLHGSVGSSGTGRSMLMSTSSSMGRSRESSGTGSGASRHPHHPSLPPIPAAAYRPGRRGGTFGSESGSGSDYGEELGGTGTRSGMISPISPSLELGAPWAGGLDDDWSPASP